MPAVDGEQRTPDALVSKVGVLLLRNVASHPTVAGPRAADHIPQFAGGNKVPDGGDDRSLASLQTDDGQALLLVTRNLLRICQALAQGPFDIDVLAGFQRGDDALLVPINTGTAYDQIDVRVVGKV